MRRCIKCSESKPLTEFHRHKRGLDGHRSTCKACASAIDKAYYAANKEKVKARHAANPERRRAASRRYAQRHREKILAKQRLLYSARYERNKEEIKRRAREWKAANRERATATEKAWRKLNPENGPRYSRTYREAHPDRKRAEKAQRRARLAAAPGTHSHADIRDILRRQRGRCAACRVDVSSSYHVDHIVALARGGSNDRTNLQILCRDCNLSKHARDPVEFMQSKGFLL